ncbi:receptor-type tyrosine-protein phosphatase S-like isoform X2 [Ornithodoros turicata]|uniref:receptor-type tyrosine-protein phosphatase S-like isoform X2 n=1 Tax=Ornithodoros turicata TaxID=34597 RepID=UPI0031391323
MVSIAFLYIMVIARSQVSAMHERYLGKVNCAFTDEHPRCNFEQLCSVTCTEDCTSAGSPIWGTVKYTQKSSLCTAAAHDLRFNYWNRTTWNVSFIRYNRALLAYKGSIRNGITSRSWLRSYGGWFEFVSPRTKEDLWDVTSVHLNYRHTPPENHHQFCFVSDLGSRSIIFRDVPVSETAYGTKMRGGLYSMTWRSDLGIRGFTCAVDWNVLSSVTSIAIIKGRDFSGNSDAMYWRSLTVNLDDRISFSDTSGQRFVWTKDGTDITLQDVGYGVKGVHRAELADGGVYVASTTGYLRSRHPEAVIRIIVRSCPGGRFGDKCFGQCPPCRNGGICHDITGVCVCPAGFKGRLCENHCSATTFGEECQHDCRVLEHNRLNCAGLLFCRPDPYGCSCFPGYTGQDCNERCPPGTYGAGCSMRRNCSCANGQPCHSQWGHCTDDKCRAGYRQPPYCDNWYPVLKTIHLSPLRATVLQVRWNKWDPQQDYGVGNPESYIVQSKEDATSRWKTIGSLSAKLDGTQGTTVYYNITGLQPDTRYMVRVLVKDGDGHMNKESAPRKTATTPCGSPQVPPQNISVEELKEGYMVVTWKIPDATTWQCSTASIEIRINQSIYQTDPNAERYSYATVPNTLYTIELRTVTGQNTASEWSPTVHVTSAERAPEVVENLVAIRVASKLYTVSWTPPKIRNGIIRGYQLGLELKRLLHCTRSPPEHLMFNISGTQTARNVSLMPAAEYSIRVRARTVADGRWTSIRVTTPDEVPEAAPRDVNVRDVFVAGATVTWKEPDCALSHGAIKGYKLKLRMDAPQKGQDRAYNTTVTSITFNGLSPFTNYSLELSAWNTAGDGPAVFAVFRTGPSVPNAPTNLTSHSASSTSIAISWLPPKPLTGKLQHYHVYYRTSEHAESTINEIPAPAYCNATTRSGRQCFAIQDLTHNTRYHIFVTAKNELVDQWSKPSNEITVTTPSAAPGPPTQFSQTSKGHKEITVSWKEPQQPNGAITNYRVNVSSVQDDGETEFLFSVTLEGMVFNETIGSLQAGSVYNITIEAATAVGYGDPISILAFTKAPVIALKVRPQVKTIQKNAVTVTLTPADAKYNIKNYYVLVEKLKTRTKRSADDVFANEWVNGKVDYNSSMAMGLSFYMAAELSPEDIHTAQDFTVGDGRYYGAYYNAPLDSRSTYQIGMAAEVDFNGDTRMSYVLLAEPINLDDTAVVSSSVITGIVAALVLVVVLAVFLSTWKARRCLAPQLLMKQSIDKGHSSSTAECLDEVDDIEMEEVACNGPVTVARLPLSQLWEYVQRMILIDGLKHEYMSVPKGQLYPSDEGKKAENKGKNRYRNMLPFDHTRVKLEDIEGLPGSDYINANYIDGYKDEKKYIATQGPKPSTCADFWRMIWQENVCKIVMLTNIFEEARSKCAKYWPEKSKTYNAIRVTLMKTEVFPEYDVNLLQVAKEGTTREVKHFHLKTWPDHGEPLYPSTLLAFHKKVSSYRTYNEAPIVVHCSAGVGRTGTYILFDILHEQALAENAVTISSQLYKLRTCRINMVETLGQYNFLHSALAESICVPDFCMSTSKFVQYHVDARTRTPKLYIEFQKLEELRPRFMSSDFSIAKAPENINRCRYANILPPNSGLVFLKDGSFINAVYVNGMYKKKAFVVTQTPSTETVEDFWKMVQECGSRTIVTFEDFSPDSDATVFWPVSGPVRYSDSRVECVESSSEGAMSTQTLKVTSKSKTTIKHFHLVKWDTPSIMLRLIDAVERWQRQSGNNIPIVLCRDGCSASGVFCCCAFFLEKLKGEHEVDVFLAARAIRKNRPQFIKNAEQYEFCYNVAQAFLESFEMYANF